MILSSVAADLVSQAFFGSAPFFSTIPHDLLVRHDYTYLLIAVLGFAAGLIGFGFKTVLYRVEDLVDRLWKGRPEWARPAVGGVALGAILLALPQMYGVGYPVVDQAIAGHTVLWLLVILMAGKIIAVSLTLSIGGSGGVFAPSLFTGAMAGMAFGVTVEHLFGPIVSSPAVFGVVAMGAVFGGAAQAPLTAIASVVEMTGNFTLILPVMLAVGIAAAVLEATQSWQHLHHQASAPRRRHRTAQTRERAAASHRIRRHAAASPGEAGPSWRRRHRSGFHLGPRPELLVGAHRPGVGNTSPSGDIR